MCPNLAVMMVSGGRRRAAVDDFEADFADASHIPAVVLGSGCSGRGRSLFRQRRREFDNDFGGIDIHVDDNNVDLAAR